MLVLASAPAAAQNGERGGLVFGATVDPTFFKLKRTPSGEPTYGDQSQYELHIGVAPTARRLFAVEVNERQRRTQGDLGTSSTADVIAGTATIYSAEGSGFFGTGGIGTERLTAQAFQKGKQFGPPVERSGVALLVRGGYELQCAANVFLNVGVSVSSGVPRGVTLRRGVTSDFVSPGRSLRVFIGLNIFHP